MNDIFAYSLLRYTHSQVLGEVFNVGILFVFPEQKRIVFRAPKHFQRIKSAYQNFQENILLNILRPLHEQVNKLAGSQDLFHYTNLNDLIHQYFILENSSALQFDTPKISVLFHQDLDKVVADTFKTYFSHYPIGEEIQAHDEAYLISKIRKNIYHNNQNLLGGVVKEKFELKTNINLDFPLYWLNGSTNLIKPISFDLTTEERIESKATKFFGKFLLLDDYALEHNYRFDVITAKPQNPKLENIYQEAVSILKGSAKYPMDSVRVIEEYQLDAYTDKIAQEAHL